MKYLGSVTDPKDIATKEYVDGSTPKPKYQQTFTVTGSSVTWMYQIPYDEGYSIEDLLNFNAYFVHEGTYGKSIGRPSAFYVTAWTQASVTIWRYYILFASSGGFYPTAGDTVVVENMFTDTDGELLIQH